jgi:NTE family protein
LPWWRTDGGMPDRVGVAAPTAAPRRGAAERPRTALVLSGGGARAAYQVGVLQGLADLELIAGDRLPFDVVVGASAGAINAAVLAAHATRFGEGLAALARLWGDLQPQHVFRTDLWSLGHIGMQWVRDLSFGGALHHVAPKALLDTAPLRHLLAERVPFADIDAAIAAGALRALAIPATNLHTSNGVVFVHGRPDVPLWRRSRWHVERARIGVEHLMASSAIPIFFPSVEIDGRHFGDGCIRNTAPLSPAINLGADRIVAVGVRESARASESSAPRGLPAPTVAQIAGVLLDAVMLDAIESDVEHSERVNTSVIHCRTDEPGGSFRRIEVLWLSPSRSFGQIAAELSAHIPVIVRYLLRGLGSDAATTELASYLLFDAAFTRRLLEIGRADVAARADEVRALLAPGEARRASTAP